MGSCTDPLRLNETRLFVELKNSLPKNVKETRNILEIRDNVLYVWNAEKYCVLTFNVAAMRGKLGENVPYQTLRLTDAPIFEITSLLINETATQLVLWGSLGIALMELPKRWGKEAVFQGGKEVITCVSHNFGNFGATTEIRQTKWHPGSTNDSHLVVLTSDNTFCLYECELGGAPRLIKSWKVGRTPSSSPSKIPDFSSLGDTAVDFDFATPTLRNAKNFMEKSINEINNSVNWNKIEWPILVLRGNGEVLIVRGNVLLDHYESPVVLGSLSMYPPADDNYGIDSCSIMCVQTTPPIVVIATCTGKIYHAILLREQSDATDEDRKNWSNYDSNYSLHTPDDALYVYECVEMELGLFFSNEDKKYNCPIHLHCDKGNKSRYFCSHNAGIHMVSLPMVSQLEEYVHSEDKDNIPVPSLSNQSNSQYLICTRTGRTAVNEATPILGFGLLQEPCVLVALLHTGDVVDLSVIDLHYLSRIEPPEPLVHTKTGQQTTKEPFDIYIKNLLKHETSQPITKIGSKTMTSRECLELLYRATDIFRTRHFAKQDKVREEISKKVRALKALKTHLLKELDTLMETKTELQQTAEHLAERYEDIKDKQEELARRAQEVLTLLNYKEPTMSATEKAETKELKKMHSKISDMNVRLEQLKQKSEKQAIHLENSENKEKRKEIVLSSNQEEAIKENLSQMTKDIKALVTDVNRLRDDVGM